MKLGNSLWGERKSKSKFDKEVEEPHGTPSDGKMLIKLTIK